MGSTQRNILRNSKQNNPPQMKSHKIYPWSGPTMEINERPENQFMRGFLKKKKRKGK